MNVLRTWYLLLRATWVRHVFGLLFLFLGFIFYPAVWSESEQAARGAGYVAGLIARLTDPVFWRKLTVGLLVAAVCIELVGLLGYYLSLLMRPAGKIDR